MTTQPTQSIVDFRRPQLTGAVSLTGFLLAEHTPTPNGISITAPYSAGGKAIVEIYHHHDLAALIAWQQVFGGEIKHQLYDRYQIYSCLSAEAFDGMFRVWTLRELSSEQQATERQMTAQWCAEHDVPADWCAETRDMYRQVLLDYRVAVAL